jgi:Flp pilus assembly protein TadB
MSVDYLLVAGYLLLAALIALPSFAAYQGRRRSRECSEFASALADYAATLRREQRCLGLDEELLGRARRLGVPELVSFEYLRGLVQPDPALLADAAQRLALRLKRRVAFARKMLARTASGRRRAALVASVPALMMLWMAASGFALPPTALGLLLVLEGIGCWLLWYLARVEV